VLVLEAHRLLPLLPRRLAVFEQPGIEPATFLKLVLKQSALLFRRLQAVLERLTHGLSGPESMRVCKGRGPVIPWLKPRGFLAHFL